MTSYEIGVVYRKNSRLYLAVSDRTLITFKDGRVQEVKPYAKYEVVRSISVESLCVRWGIPLSELDTVTSKYLAPAADGVVRARPRGSRRRRSLDEDIWRNLRMIRMARTA